MDQADRDIIQALQIDGRMPYSEAARRVGYADATVRGRVDRMRRQGIIKVQQRSHIGIRRLSFAGRQPSLEVG